jgi:hypothetical protein
MRGELYSLCRVKVNIFSKKISFLELFSKQTLDEVFNELAVHETCIFDLERV